MSLKTLESPFQPQQISVIYKNTISDDIVRAVKVNISTYPLEEMHKIGEG